MNGLQSAKDKDSIMRDIESVRILRLKPGDEIVLKVSRTYGEKDLLHLKSQAEKHWPGHRIIVLSDVDIEVVRS